MGPKKAAVPERKIEVTLPYRIPVHVDLPAEGHMKWLLMLNEVEKLIMADDDLQKKAAKGLRLKERKLPMEVLGRMYAQYCTLLNRLYDAYLNSVHLQRAPYMLDIISICMKRLYELRNELVHYIVNDYIYVDTPLTQLRLTPYDIQIVVPYHFAVDSRPGSVEDLLQKMWLKAYKRKHKKPRKPKPVPDSSQKNLLDDPEMDITAPAPTSTTENADPSAVDIEVEEEEEEEEESESEHSEHTILSDDYIQALLIQRHERYRFYYMVAYRDICANRLMYFAPKIEPAPQAVRDRAAAYIQKVYREFMRLKRKMVLDEKRDIILGLIPDIDLRPRNYEEERNKLYDRRRNEREKIRPRFLEQIEKENKKLLFLNKGEQIEDITVSVMEWFAEWYYGYGFFPRYPHELEGGTMIVMTGEFPTVDEQKAEDERIKNLTKGKTKETLKQERQQAKLEAKMKAELAEEAKKKEKIALFKARCNPDSDPGYDPKMSEHMDAAKETLMKYRQTWSIYDEFPPKECADIVYGFINSVITEDLMHQIHIDARKFVDELMRLELKLFIKAQQTMFQRVGWKFPKTKPKRPPPAPPIPKPFIVDRKLLKNIEPLFDLGIVTKPTAKLGDIVGDLNFAACELNVLDPDVKYPPPGYGDVVRRLVLSCVFGSGVEPGASRNRAVLLVGQPRNGKSFLVDCIAGEMNAVKIDISPENFSAKISKAGKMLNYVFNAARVFQPSIIFCKNIEKVFYKKVPPKEKHEKAKTMKKPLSKLVKAIPITEKVIFIATCSDPFLAQIRPMVSLFDEVILVPRTDYGSLQRFFYDRLQSIRSIPRDYNVHGLAKVMQGVGFGVVIEMVDKVLTAERICRLNVTPLLQSEFLEYLIANDIEPMLMSEYKKYEEFYMNNSALKKEREEYNIINFVRADAYKKLAKKKEEDEKKAEAKRLAKSA